ncbi:major capsid protein [Paenibacillus alkaliterrae]|uniref:major capsid protein n=1 Tax=Paenibacillus alkaliterrae TaxID=320909 RepID=UPI001F2F0F08|nr:major capsid protein [Paenibacillus alkaliterrae]MCF2939038.1 major capsid protein [Paenibacillus alkaliterrae]
MPKTQIADVIVPQVFNPYVIQRTMELSALSQSGIISNNSELDALAAGGGKLINMPYWNDLTGDDEVLSDSGALTPQKITTGQDVAALFLRGKAWSANDLAHVLAGADPMAAIGDLVAAFWARKRQAHLFAMLKGVFAAASMSGNVHDISANAGTAAVLGGETFIDAQTKLGDAAGGLTGFSMHSAAYALLKKQNLIETVKDSEGNEIEMYMKKRVIVDDGHPVAAGVYTSYLFGQGAIGLGNGMAKYPTETDRDKLAGDDILINRQSYILHPRGVKFNAASVAGSTPTNLECEAAANWTRVYDNKAIRIVRFVYKLA